MFKTLEIKNFKSIAHAKFDLGKINVLTGQSNLGKSNVVQAIYCLTHNHWDSNYMRWGEKKCSIKLTDENDEWVEYRHSETSSEYSLSSAFYKDRQGCTTGGKGLLKNELRAVR